MTDFSGGWFYDQQRDISDLNRMTSMSLHANKATEDFGKTWNAEGITDLNGTMHKEREGDIDKLWSGRDLNYFKYPIATSIVDEDFNVTVANSFSDCGGDPIGDIFNQYKPLAPFVQIAADGLEKISETMEARKNNEYKNQDQNSYVAKGINKAVDFLGDTVLSKEENGQSVLSDYLNRSLVVQGSRFSYFNGSGVSFSNITMKFTLFPQWNDYGDFITVNSQINRIFPYIIGKYVKEDGEAAEFISNHMGISKQAISEFIGWQLPPGGFEPDIKNVDTTQMGTLKLKIGPYYSISNLVAESCQFNFSKQMVKNPKQQFSELSSDKVENDSSLDLIQSEIITPLFCDVILTLKPMCKYTGDTVRAFTQGTGVSNEIEDTNKILKKRLNSISDEIEDKYLSKNNKALQNGVHPSLLTASEVNED